MGIAAVVVGILGLGALAAYAVRAGWLQRSDRREVRCEKVPQTVDEELPDEDDNEEVC
jgi:hypothetical protein